MTFKQIIKLARLLAYDSISPHPVFGTDDERSEIIMFFFNQIKK